MSETAINVPAAHLDAVRQALLARRDAAAPPSGLDDLLAQLAAALERGDASCRLAGPRPLLWSAVYDSLCAAAEQLADDCNEYWRGVVGPDAARARVDAVSARLDLLVELGAPPSA